MSAIYLAGYDGTAAARAAVGFAAALGPEDARVIAVNVYPDVTDRFTAEGASATLQRDLRAESERLLATLEEPGAEHRSVAANSPAQGLHELAAERQAALVAIGVTYHGWLGRTIPGTVGYHLLHGSPCPVAVTPAGDWRRLDTIAVAYDGTPEADEALAYGASLARRRGARLLLVGVAARAMHAAAAATGYGFNWTLPEGAWEDFTRGFRVTLDAAAERIGGAPAVQTRVLTATPVGQALVDTCRADVDLMVIGSRGFGPLRTVIMGSVSRHVIDHAPCPVIVVPRGAE
jgi:nucleotide-binding universal stress UspA family protein